MPLTVTLVIVTPNAVEFVIFICCCALLPTFTDPKFIEVGLTLTDDADAALLAKINSNNSITAIGDAKEILFDMFPICPLPEGECGAIKTTGALGFSRRRESTNCPRRASTGLEARTRTG